MFCFKNKKEISEDVGAAAGTTARHAGLKVAAVILAGVVGGGGVTYGVVKNADKIPVIQNFVEEKDVPVVKIAEKPKEEKTESTAEPEVQVTEPVEEKTVDHTPAKTESSEKENSIFIGGIINEINHTKNDCIRNQQCDDSGHGIFFANFLFGIGRRKQCDFSSRM